MGVDFVVDYECPIKKKIGTIRAKKGNEQNCGFGGLFVADWVKREYAFGGECRFMACQSR